MKKLKWNTDMAEVILIGKSKAGGRTIVLSIFHEISADPDWLVAKNLSVTSILLRRRLLFLYQVDVATWIHATVTSTLDYYNVFNAGLSTKMTQKLQLVQNAVVGFIGKQTNYVYKPCPMATLHWLLVSSQVPTITYKALNGLGPTYLNVTAVTTIS